jgi:FkbM family methyltransferase
MLRTLFKRLLSASVGAVLGRKGMLHLGKFLCNEARLDRGNDFATNGEQLVQACLARLAGDKPNGVILDVGANIGEWSRHLAGRFDKSVDYKIYAFEPCRGTFHTLCRNVEQWRLTERVTPCNLALSSKNGEARFYSLGDNQGCNSLYPQRDGERSVETVHCGTLDHWCAENKINQILFLKIDTEGNEVEVLYGARELLEARKIDMIQFEYTHYWIPPHRFLVDVFDLLAPLDYRIGKITWKGVQFYPQWHVDLETFVEGNYLAVKPEYVKLLPVVG